MSEIIEATHNKQALDLKATTKIFQIVYILYLLALVFPLLAIAGLIFTYVFRYDAKDYLKSHVQFLLRTFWIGLLYILISSVLCFVLIGFLLLFITAIWWLIRLAIGLKALLEQSAVPNPKSWWV